MGSHDDTAGLCVAAARVGPNAAAAAGARPQAQLGHLIALLRHVCECLGHQSHLGAC